MLEKLYGRKVALRPQFLEAAGKKQILKRMLVNLKAIYLRNNSVGEALSIFDHLIILDPAGAEEIRDRGSLYLHMGCFRQAREDLTHISGWRLMRTMRRWCASRSPALKTAPFTARARAEFRARLLRKLEKATGKGSG